MDDIYPTTLALKDYALSPCLIDNVAVEFYGKIAAHAGASPEETCTVEFRDFVHEYTEKRVCGLECMMGFLAAMDSYRRANA